MIGDWIINGVAVDKMGDLQLQALCETEVMYETGAARITKALSEPKTLDEVMLAIEPEAPNAGAIFEVFDPEWIEFSDTEIVVCLSEDDPVVELTFRYHEMPDRFHNLEKALQAWAEHKDLKCYLNTSGYGDNLRTTWILIR